MLILTKAPNSGGDAWRCDESIRQPRPGDQSGYNCREFSLDLAENVNLSVQCQNVVFGVFVEQEEVETSDSLLAYKSMKAVFFRDMREQRSCLLVLEG